MFFTSAVNKRRISQLYAVCVILVAEKLVLFFTITANKFRISQLMYQ